MPVLDEPTKELKLTVPLRIGVRLYAMKTVLGKTMSTIVTEALDAHLAQLEKEAEARRAAAATA